MKNNPQMTKKRTFSTNQKRALFILADGKCRVCGKDLPEDWHADHIKPYSRGGKTDIINGQALCPECNLKKGNRITTMNLKPWPEHKYDKEPYITWQKRFLDTYNKLNKQDFLLEACPSGGKTIAVLRVMHALLMEGTIEQLIIVVPSEHLKKQWASVCYSVGLKIHPKWEPSNTFKGYHGVVITYQALSANPDIYKYHVDKKATGLLFDEIHHCGETKSWCEACQQAFQNAIKRLLFSGTPFRSDNNRIPFVTYLDNKSVYDFQYRYYDALTDGVSRHVLFPTYDGKTEWFEGTDLFVSNSLSDELSREQEANRLRTLLYKDSKYLIDLLEEAHKQLTLLRNTTDPNAGAILFAIDKEHAEDMANLLEKITHKRPTLVHYENSESSDQIKKFNDSNDEWIVSIKMVSEGVDIKRLRVGVFATNVLTRMFFRQAMGRVIRRYGKDENDNLVTHDQTAWFYVPKIPRLSEYMREVNEEIPHEIKEKLDITQNETSEGEGDSSGSSTEDKKVFNPKSAEVTTEGGWIDGHYYGPEKLRMIEEHAKAIPTDLLTAARSLRLALWQSENDDIPFNSEGLSKIELEPYEYEARLRTVCTSLTNSIAGVLSEKSNKPIEYFIKNIHARWKAKGNNGHKTSSNEDMERKEQWLQVKNKQLNNGAWQYDKDFKYFMEHKTY